MGIAASDSMRERIGNMLGPYVEVGLSFANKTYESPYGKKKIGLRIGGVAGGSSTENGSRL